MHCKVLILAIALFFLLPSCGAAENKKKEVISIEIGKLSPVEVGVMTPGGRFIFLRNDGVNCQGVSVLDGKVLIVPSKSVGIYWDSEGAQNLTATFAEPGVFTVYVSDNLETEFDNSSSISRRYVNNGNYKASISADSCRGGRVD
ncbi:hypothetical protein [Xanthomonas medicagonis]|uniref:hypothetical protein n=1 Tax=Xanthomonas medicagonis TaxID=3160841 RepID=UPI003519A650